MPDLTVSATIDAFMGAADAAAARTAISAEAAGAAAAAQSAAIAASQPRPEERTASFTAADAGVYITTATLTVNDPSPVQGYSYSVEVRNGTATIGGTAYAAPCRVVRTFHAGAWADWVDSPDASFLTAGIMPSARLAADCLKSQANRETFIYDDMAGSGVNGPGQWTASTSGGSWATTSVQSGDRYGVVRAATGTAASTNQRGAAHTGTPGSSGPIRLGGMLVEWCADVAPALALFSGGLSGEIFVGLASGVTVPSHGVYLASRDGGNWLAVTRASSIETVTDTGVAPALGTWVNYRVDVEADRSAVRHYVNGALVATHTTNIPAANVNLSQIISVNRVSTTGTSVALDVDFAWLRLYRNANRW